MSNSKFVLLIAFGLVFVFFLTRDVKKEDKSNPIPIPNNPVLVDWTPWFKIRNGESGNGDVYADVMSHTPNPKTWSDRITTVHENTHFINADIRNKSGKFGINAFYCLKDRACIIEEPPITIQKIAPTIPNSMRGPSYQLYLINHDPGWSKCPLYLCDEFSAYLNGATCGFEGDFNGCDFELLQSANFSIYCTYLAKKASEDCPGYDHKQLKNFLKYQIERVKNLASSNSEKTKQANEYLLKAATVPECEPMRTFARSYYGDSWCKINFGF